MKKIKTGNVELPKDAFKNAVVHVPLEKYKQEKITDKKFPVRLTRSEWKTIQIILDSFEDLLESFDDSPYIKDLNKAKSTDLRIRKELDEKEKREKKLKKISLTRS